jgi:hypothetical protein
MSAHLHRESHRAIRLSQKAERSCKKRLPEIREHPLYCSRKKRATITKSGHSGIRLLARHLLEVNLTSFATLEMIICSREPLFVYGIVFCLQVHRFFLQFFLVLCVSRIALERAFSCSSVTTTVRGEQNTSL